MHNPTCNHIYTRIHFGFVLCMYEWLMCIHACMYLCRCPFSVVRVQFCIYCAAELDRGQACSLLLSPCHVCLFLSASQPHLPPPHSAWGVIKSVYACPQSKEIGIHTHTQTHIHHKHPCSHLSRHALTHSDTVQTQIYKRIYLPTSPRQAFEHKTSNIYSVLYMVCHKITFSQPVTLRMGMAANLLYLQQCVCACVCVYSTVIKPVHIRSCKICPHISSSPALYW